jgi:hypothetical protein
MGIAHIGMMVTSQAGLSLLTSAATMYFLYQARAELL